MTNFGFIRVGAAIPEVKVCDCFFNVERMKELILEANDHQVEILCFPELSITAYTCGDLFNQQFFIESAEKALQQLLDETRHLAITFIAGIPVRTHNKLYNAAVVCQQGNISGIVPKSYLPNEYEFYEKRWFAEPATNSPSTIIFAGQQVPFGVNLLFGNTDCLFAIEICEDLWTTIPPSSFHALNGANIIFNLSASNELAKKHAHRKSLIAHQSARCISGYVYASSGWGESTTDVVHTGNALICENGAVLAEAQRFLMDKQLITCEIDTEQLNAGRQQKAFFRNTPLDPEYNIVPMGFSQKQFFRLKRSIPAYPFVPFPEDMDNECDDILGIQIFGLAKRLTHTQVKHVVIGVSGGLDSTLALLTSVFTSDALGWPRDSIIGVTMPGFGTTSRTLSNAHDLMNKLGITTREINIEAACKQHFKDIGHDPEIHDITYENSQARERTQLLMDIANQTGGLVVGTGNMSELALGWATYNGDHMSMYGINSGIPKTLVRQLVHWIASVKVDEDVKRILLDILNTPASPELLPSANQVNSPQSTEDYIGPYELHDFFLYYFLRFGFSPEKIYFLAQQAWNCNYSNETILHWMEVFFKRFFSQQFKRSCLPDGPKTGSVNLSPRGNWKMPSDASCQLWLDEIRGLINYSRSASE